MTEDIKLTIGSDPEFVIMCGDSVENALEIFQKVSLDMQCECECPHPDAEDIESIYNSMWSIYIRDALESIGTKLLHKKHPRFVAEEYVKVMMDYHDKKVSKVVKKIISSLSINEKELEDAADELIYFESKGKYMNRRLIHIMLAVKNKIAYEKLDIYEKIPKTKVDIFEENLIDKIIEYYSLKGYPNLDELHDEIQEIITDEIVSNYEYDCSSCEERESYFCTTEIGCDGQSALGELRPKHGNDPIEHFNEILKLMKKLNELLSPEIICYKEDLQIKAGAVQGEKDDIFQLGGHIHLGCNKYIKIQYWDEYLSFFCGIPLTLITDTENKFVIRYVGKVLESERNIRHKKEQYGEYGNYRSKTYGIEFRMPSSWLVSPQITIGALSLAYVVGNEFILHLKKGTELIWQKMFEEKYGYHHDKYIEWYKNQNWVLLQGEFEPIKLEIQKMELYPKYKEYIDYIFDMIDNNETWHSEGNILPRWAELW